MRAKRNSAKQITGRNKDGGTKNKVDDQFEVLIKQLSACLLDIEEAALYKRIFNEALKKAVENKLPNFNESEFSKTDTIVLNETHKNEVQFSEEVFISKRIILIEYFKKTVSLLIAVSLITLGFSMIVLPAPPYFEMFTIFYFNDEDGVTIMDLISLIIILCGVYLFIIKLIKNKRQTL